MTNEHADGERTGPERGRGSVVDRVNPPATGPAPPLAVLQRQVGNRAVVGLLTRPGTVVQRDPVGFRRGGDDGPRLHLDPEIEAQIRAIAAMQAMLAAEPVRAGLLDLTMPSVPAPSGGGATPQPAPAPTPPAPPPATATGPAPGTGLMGPRAGTGGDVWKAVLAEPSLGPAITALGDQAAARARSQWDRLSTGGAVAVVTGSVVIAGGAVAGVLANRDARQWITATLNDKIIPVPRVPGLGLQLNLSGNDVVVGLHLDVGTILPAALGFGPASATTPLGRPLPDPVQRVTVDHT